MSDKRLIFMRSLFSSIAPRVLFLQFTVFLVTLLTATQVGAQTLIPPTGTLKVAYVGDVGVKSTSEQVLQLVKKEGADLLVIVGDFDYQDNPQKFFDIVMKNTGGNIPVLLVVGNHDTGKWDGATGYKALFRNKLNGVPGLVCTGDFGINGECTYKGVKFLLSGVGTKGNSHDAYLTSQLTTSPNLWNICVWHVAIETFQVGEKSSTRHLNSYEICRQNGAQIMTAHEHSYHRTRTLNNMITRTIAPSWGGTKDLAVGPGLTFVTVSGAGGESMRSQNRCLPGKPPYGCREWAFIYTSTQGARFGAQFITYGNGGPNKATGYFKNIKGEVVDEFTITNTKVSPPPTSPSPSPTLSPTPSPTATPTTVRGDFNNDNLVNLLDHTVLVRSLHTVDARYNLVGSSNDVDLYDYNELLNLVR